MGEPLKFADWSRFGLVLITAIICLMLYCWAWQGAEDSAKEEHERNKVKSRLQGEERASTAGSPIRREPWEGSDVDHAQELKLVGP